MSENSTVATKVSALEMISKPNLSNVLANGVTSIAMTDAMRSQLRHRPCSLFNLTEVFAYARYCSQIFFRTDTCTSAVLGLLMTGHLILSAVEKARNATWFTAPPPMWNSIDK